MLPDVRVSRHIGGGLFESRQRGRPPAPACRAKYDRETPNPEGQKMVVNFCLFEKVR